MRKKISAAQVAADYLRETGNPSVMMGDSWLLHAIATKLGYKHDGPKTQKKVMDAIDRTNNGELFKFLTSFHRLHRVFRLPETVPDSLLPYEIKRKSK